MGILQSRYNYAAAFAKYITGMSLDECATACSIPFDTLRQHASDEGWVQLAQGIKERQNAELALVSAPSAGLAKVEANRELALREVRRVQNIVAFAVQELEHEAQHGPKVVMKRIVTKKGDIIEVPVSEKLITFKNLRDLTCAVQTLQDLAYRATGDVGASKGLDSGKEAVPIKIEVILPSFIATPRNMKRTIELEPENKEHKSLDITDTSHNDDSQ